MILSGGQNQQERVIIYSVYRLLYPSVSVQRRLAQLKALASKEQALLKFPSENWEDSYDTSGWIAFFSVSGKQIHSKCLAYCLAHKVLSYVSICMILLCNKCSPALQMRQYNDIMRSDIMKK